MHSLILGGTKGLGAEISKFLELEGSPTLAIGRSKIANHDFLFCDLSSESSTRNFLRTLEEKVAGGLVISNFYWVAGVLTRANFAELSEEKLLHMIDVNLRHPLLIARWIWQYFQTSQYKHQFSVVASTIAISDTPKEAESVYAATKAAQVSFVRAIGKNNKNSRIKVSLFCPGGMRTSFWDSNQIDQKTLDSFLDPGRVAAKILFTANSQTLPYQELVIPRTSL